MDVTDSAREESTAVERLRLLARASEALAAAGLDVASVLRAIAESVTELLAECSSITLLSETDGFFDVVAIHDRNAKARELLEEITSARPRLPSNEGLLGRVMQEQRPVILAEVDPAWMRDTATVPFRPYVAEFMPRSIVVVPIRARGKLLGTFSLVRRTGEGFTSDDAELALEIADHAGLAIDNARLYTRAEEARARAEAALAQTEAAVQARDDIIAVVSHDLRNPLSVITMAAAGIAHEATNGQRRRAEMILRAAARMQRLLGDLLDVAQIDAGAFAVDPRPYHLPTLLQEARDGLLAVVAEREQELAVSPSEVRIRVDRERFLQALSNLVGNASKFSPPRTKITIETRVTELAVEISVSDEGPGIPAHAVSTIFDRFVQSTTDPVRRRGVGLGLAIVRGIVAAHGGDVVAENLPSRGARFRMRFPPVADATGPTAPELAAFLGSSSEDAATLLSLADLGKNFDDLADRGWQRGPAEGVWERPLARDLHTNGARALLVAIAGGATYPMHTHESSETLLILSGGLRDNDGAELWVGDSVRNARDTSHGSTALPGGCLLVALLGS